MAPLKGEAFDELDGALGETIYLFQQMRHELSTLEPDNIKRTLTETVITLAGMLNALDDVGQ